MTASILKPAFSNGLGFGYRFRRRARPSDKMRVGEHAQGQYSPASARQRQFHKVKLSVRAPPQICPTSELRSDSFRSTSRLTRTHPRSPVSRLFLFGMLTIPATVCPIYPKAQSLFYACRFRVSVAKSAKLPEKRIWLRRPVATLNSAPNGFPIRQRHRRRCGTGI